MVDDPAMMSSAIPVHISEILSLIKDILLPIFTFFIGLFFPHVQKPLTDYRQTLTDISKKMLCSVPVIYADPPLPTLRSQGSAEHSELKQFYDDIRSLHAQLVSSADSIPRFARPVLKHLDCCDLAPKSKKAQKCLLGFLTK